MSSSRGHSPESLDDPPPIDQTSEYASLTLGSGWGVMSLLFFFFAIGARQLVRWLPPQLQGSSLMPPVAVLAVPPLALIGLVFGLMGLRRGKRRTLSLLGATLNGIVMILSIALLLGILVGPVALARSVTGSPRPADTMPWFPGSSSQRFQRLERASPHRPRSEVTRDDSNRGSWGSGLGFVLAAAGSAVGLGNIWRFPYITGENGGGLFVLIYLGCIALIGLPVMIGEVLIGRASQRSTVSAFKTLAGPSTPWAGLGWLGVIAAYCMLSFYGVVAGWTLHYTVLSARGAIAGKGAEEILAIFQSLNQDAGLNIFWFVLFMVITVLVVLGGIERGIERWSVILMPALLIMLLGLMVRAISLDGFSEAFHFVFGLNADRLTPGGILEALGHSFFTLSVGMGGMLTYGSYLSKKESIVGNAITVSALDTFIALIACLVIFPITFSYGLEAAAGPGLIFTTLPIAFGLQMPPS